MNRTLTRYARRTAVVLTTLGFVSFLLFVAVEVANAQEVASLRLHLPDQKWTLVSSQSDALLHDPILHTYAKPRTQAFAFTLANELAEHDIGIAHSAIVIGRKFGNGWNVYIGHVSSLPKRAIGPPVHGVAAIHGGFAVGVEWHVRF